MNYELAKELKDAGFPLKPCSVGPDCEQWWYMPHQETLHAPTLEELIEACGEKFVSLFKVDTGWRTTGEIAPADLDRFQTLIDEEGSTPTEAVARLWLALNQKNDK